MGTDPGEIPALQEMFKIRRAELFTDETPRRRVRIDSFYLDKHEVTNAEFKKFLDRNPAWRKDKIPAALHNGKYLQDWTGNDFPKEKANHPVVFVTWRAAVAYCQSLGKRLPTEAEWEFAARGGLRGKQFPWGDELADAKGGLRLFGTTPEVEKGRIFEQEQIAQAVKLSVGVGSPDRIEFLTDDKASADYVGKIKKLLI